MIAFDLIESEKYGGTIKRLRRRLQRMVEGGPTPGATMAIAKSDGSIWSEGFGYRDLAKSGLVDNKTIFQIGSTTKVFTGLAFMLAVQNGLVTLDDRLIDHWPEFSINSVRGEDEYQKITFRHLLSHRAGMPRDPRRGGIFGCDVLYTFEEMVESIKECWMVAPVNNRYYYSNIGMDIVAYALQRITGMKYPLWVKEKLGKPLGIDTLRYGSGEALKESNVAIGTENGIWNCEFAASEDYGCGDVWIGGLDLAKLLILLMNRGNYDGYAVLEGDLYDEITRPHFAKDNGHNYGLGVDIYGGFTPRILGHGGGSLGYGSTFYWVPDHGFGVSVQTNMEFYSSSKKSPHNLGLEAREYLLKLDGAILLRPIPEEYLREKIVAPKIDDISQLAGFYVGLWNNSVIISYKDEKLLWHDRFEMTPKGNGFLLPSGNAVRFNFRRKNSKQPYGVTYVNPRYPVAELNLFRVKVQGIDSSPAHVEPSLSKAIEGIYKATYYGHEVTFILAKADDSQLLVNTIYGMRPVFPHESIEGLFFGQNGEAVTYSPDELWVENVRGVKWDDPVTELKELVQNKPNHRLLSKIALSQLATHLKTLGRSKEAKEIRSISKKLHSKRS
ncbi:MAG: serine hydrolase domain-containing protein, partial [Promethearchaeota archaeon]